MGRTLPWKRKGATVNAPPVAAARRKADEDELSSRARSPSTTAGTPSRSAPRSKGTKSSINLHKRRARSPSTSPPPEPVAESFMIRGLENDDQWRMVEDEFLTVAGAFTAHLHAAEYQRLKNQAKNQNADTIKTISRPVTGDMMDLVKRRYDALARASKQRKGIKRSLSRMKAEDLDEDELEGERPWAGTSLQGLMDSPRKKSVILTSITSPAAGRRATALDGEQSPSRDRGLPRKAQSRSYSNANQISVGHRASPRGKGADGVSSDAKTLGGSTGLDGPAKRQSDFRAHRTLSPTRRASAQTAIPSDDDADGELELTDFERYRQNRSRPVRRRASPPTRSFPDEGSRKGGQQKAVDVAVDVNSIPTFI